VTTEPGVEELLRQLTPQVLGALLRRYGQFDLCEDAVQEALLAAAVQWPERGIPESPRGWLITVASRRMTDQLRGESARRRREETAAALSPSDGLVAMVRGPRAGLDLLATLDADDRLAGHHRLDAVSAHLLEMAGDTVAARERYRAAARRTTSLPEQRYLEPGGPRQARCAVAPHRDVENASAAPTSP